MEKSTKKIVLGVAIAFFALFGGILTIKSIERIPTGYVGVQYSMNGGVKDDVLLQGWHFISPTIKTKDFTISNEQLILSKDKREGSKSDESFKVATSDNASIAISFQMSYRFKAEDVVNTYKNFKGMDGEDIVNQRVRTVLKSTISEVTTNYSMMEIYSGNRAVINNEITEKLNTEFSEKYGIEVLDASIIDVHPDDKLKESIDNRVTALQASQQAQAEQEKVAIEKETEKIQAEADAEIAITKANAEAEQTRIKAQAEADANKMLADSITEPLISSKEAEAKVKEAEAHMKHGFVTVQGATTVVTDSE